MMRFLSGMEGSGVGRDTVRSVNLDVAPSVGPIQLVLPEHESEIPMQERNHRVILAVEASVENGRHLMQCLMPLEFSVCLATSREEVFGWLRRRIFRRAIVAAELAVGREMMIARLARLPAMKCLIAVGPPGDMDLEARCLVAGAKTYLSRPVSTELLAATMRVPMPSAPVSSTIIGEINDS